MSLFIIILELSSSFTCNEYVVVAEFSLKHSYDVLLIDLIWVVKFLSSRNYRMAETFQCFQ